MKNHYLFAVLFAFAVPACTESSPQLVEDREADKADSLRTTPHGSYKFEDTLNGTPSSGDLLTLSLTPSRTFSATVADDLFGTTSHQGTYKFYVSSDHTSYYIDFIEATQRQRFEYSIDVIDNETLWLRAPGTERLYGMSFVGEDCTSAGCGAGETCSACWGENVCLPAGTDC